jgi:hypothetical protein
LMPTPSIPWFLTFEHRFCLERLRISVMKKISAIKVYRLLRAWHLQANFYTPTLAFIHFPHAAFARPTLAHKWLLNIITDKSVFFSLKLHNFKLY